ncbi:unnamed protein product [Boreogadus saida]
MAVIFLKQFQNLVEEDRSKRKRAVVEALHVLRPRVNIILKSGTEWQIMLDMDDHTFARHFRVSKTRFEVLKGYLQEGGLQSDHSHGLLPIAKKVLMFLWYMGNQNCFREISDKFNVSSSSSHRAILQVLTTMSTFGWPFVSWPKGCASIGCDEHPDGCPREDDANQ